MQDLKLKINIDLQGKNEVEKLFNVCEKPHSIKIETNVDETKTQYQSFGSSISGVFEKIQSNISQFGLAMHGIHQAIDLIKSSVQQFVQPASDFEFMRTRLVNLYQDADKATEVFEYFQQVALSTPFNMLGVVEAGAQLKAFGMNAEETIKPIADLAAYMGIDVVEAANAVGRAFAGGAGAADILRERGVLNLISEFKGIEDLTQLTLPEFREAMISTFMDSASGIAGATDLLADTYVGSVAIMGDAWTNFSATMGANLMPTIKAGVDAIGEFLRSITPVKSQLEKVTSSTSAQQAEFRALIGVYETLRFKQGESVESNEALKSVVEKLNTQFGSYLGNIDLATAKYDEFRLSVAKATDELIKEATTKKVLAEREDFVNKVGDINYSWVKKSKEENDKLVKLQEEFVVKQEWLFEKVKEFQNAGRLGHLFVPVVEQAAKSVASAEKRIENQLKRIDSLNEKMKKKRDLAQADLDEFIATYSSVLSNAAAETPDKVDFYPKDMLINNDQLEKDLENLLKKLKEKETILRENYETEKEIIELSQSQGMISQEDYNAYLKQLKERLNDELSSLKREEYEAEISFAEKKKSLGIMTYQELQIIVDGYYDWVVSVYGKEAREYTDALNMKRNAALRHQEELKQDQDLLLKELREAWDQYSQMYRYDLIELNNLKVIHGSYKALLGELGLKSDELALKIAEVDDEMKKLSIRDFADEMSFLLRALNDEFRLLKHVIESTANSIADSFSTVFSQLIIEGRSFSKIMQQSFKNMAIQAINEINRIIARMLVLKALGLITGNPITWGGAVMSAVGFSRGGYVSGEGTGTSDSIPAMLSNGEYVINAKKTSMFKPFLDYLNYSPLPAIQKAFAGVSLPAINVPAMPKISYAAGGYVRHHGLSFDTKNLEKRLDRVIERLDAIEKKDYSVTVKTKFKGVEFAREIEKAQYRYREVVK